ncbi:minor histocompatibility antigen H13 [Marchantia polymorpha subsp. ruderalis]|uniref:Uncharacterized protein n=2 Tax=Marchantia polymorpha TaxID=3197 RepID=A0A2R6WCS1_MARPO|nr:hypothetical protein MARPO_0108s0004 [Marchantia polymorpha]BBN19800.1 hypothetical protein Mp_8g13760 [Marchantia polymorpha subsp. ruderalis]|eukprot:PTQ31650.1 hypothetical protein MARPO_0108s0004 [Marchantia polymorpha]
MKMASRELLASTCRHPAPFSTSLVAPKSVPSVSSSRISAALPLLRSSSCSQLYSALRTRRNVDRSPASQTAIGRSRRHIGVVPRAKKDEENATDGIVLTTERDDEDFSAAAIEPGWGWNKTTKELVAYGLLVAAVPIVPLLPRFEWSGAFYFLFLAVWSVYVGSHRSLMKKPPQKMSLNQGLAVPLFCSASLFGFYCLLRFFPDLDLRTFISAYLGVAGAVAVGSNIVEPFRLLLPDSTSWRVDLPKWLVQDDGSPVHLTVTPADIAAGAVGVLATIASKQAGAPFTLKNFIAVCIVTELLQLLSLGTFTTAAAMLSGLLLYDVFWVFGSSHVFGDNVMVTVATSSAFDGPMKLIFPRFGEGAMNPYSILGLGDIAAPGLLIAMMLRFDRSRARLSSSADESSSPDKTYFVTCLASYIFGLTVTVVANTVSGAAQPALLYLVPSLLLGVFAVAAFRSEASLLLDYKDETLMSAIPVKSEDETK